MRLGDYNLDGYFDVLLSVSNSSGSDVSQLWENVACCTCFFFGVTFVLSTHELEQPKPFVTRTIAVRSRFVYFDVILNATGLVNLIFSCTRGLPNSQ